MKEYEKESMTEVYAREISNWNYEDLYSDYNLPSYEEMKEKKYGITNEENYKNYICFVDNGNLIAYSSMKEMETGVFLGIGIRPDSCGKGLGKYFLRTSVDEIKKRYLNRKIFLEVRSWNERAIKSYKTSGFKIIKTVVKKDRLGNEIEFIEMEME